MPFCCSAGIDHVPVEYVKATVFFSKLIGVKSWMAQGSYRLRLLAGEKEYEAGEALYSKGGVRALEQSGMLMKYVVAGTPRREVIFTPEEPAKCTCDEWNARGACRHVVAATLMAQESGAMEDMIRQKAVLAGPKLMSAMESALPEDGTLRMEVTLVYENGTPSQKAKLRLGLRVGEERLYVVRSIPQMIEAIDAGTTMEFGKGFVYHPEWMRFGPAETRLLGILRALCLAEKEAGASLRGADLRVMALPEPFAEAVLKELENLPFRMAVGEKAMVVKRVRAARLPLHYRVTGSLRGLTITALFPKDFQPITASCAYAVVSGTVVAVDPGQQSVMRVLWQEQIGGRSMFDFPMKETTRVIGEVIPFLKLTGVVEMDPDLERQLVRLPLVPQVYLDREGKEVVARTQFCYGEDTIDPFDDAAEMETLPRTGKVLLRDAAAERQVLDALGSAGFYVRKNRVYLTGQDAIFDFVSGGVQKLQNMCEVYLSRDFRKMTPRKPVLQGRMRMNGGRLEMTFTEDGEPAEEILSILEALSKHRRYFRLKDGSFLDLSGMDEWQSLADSVFEAANVEGADAVSPAEDTVSLSAYRTCYLHSLLSASSLPIEVDSSVQDTVKALVDPDEEKIQLPAGLSLRPYQQRGFHWLMTLDKLHMGGILADDMGLGKTVQVIAMLKATRKPGQTSLVVAPTSLTYNWLSELERFTPELSVMVMAGSGPQRASQIEHVKKAKDVDVLITSYPLIRRDIDLMKDMDFRFVILDEAQHIKNAGSVGAVAVKQLHGQTRFALTGTPMENSAGELWSIFDFVLPGYLFSYSSFLRKYQDGEDLDDLRRRIRPFLMRRLKKDVLTELPDKLETTLTAQMSPEQEKVYQAAMVRLRDRVDHVMTEKGLGRGRTEVLAAITELRQICCHPSLVLSDYAGTSGKMEMLLEILPGALQAGRRILLFSQFTSMLKILKDQLENAGYSCMYLDGETPPQKRLEMTEQFNGGTGQIFLISLKAGGTGLNLTGADMVIHYDPWWNPAAEDQATDRAHRIGQTKKVEVIRLVTHGSIEEQVVALGQRKKALFDQLITPGEELVTALTEQDIRALFS